MAMEFLYEKKPTDEIPEITEGAKVETWTWTWKHIFRSVKLGSHIGTSSWKTCKLLKDKRRKGLNIPKGRWNRQSCANLFPVWELILVHTRPKNYSQFYTKLYGEAIGL
jgi:hypothetical protein